MARKYTDKELSVLQFLVQKYGHLTYQQPALLEEEYEQLTGIRRASGCLYMAAWRLENGLYDDRLRKAS
jgi:hypothetical protein